MMEESWQDFLRAYNNRNLQEIDNTLNNLLAVRKNSGFANATSYSLALLALAQQAHERHDDTGARTLVDKALNLSPDYSFPYQAESQLYFARKQWFSSLNSCFSGIKILFSNYLERLQLFAGICFVLAFLPLWLFVSIHIVLSLKYFRALRESWERQLDSKSAAIILFAILFSGNALIWHSFMLLPGLMLLFICFFPYYSFREKACSFVLIFLLTISPFAYLNGIKIIDSIRAPFFQSAMSINFDSYQDGDQQNIIQPQTLEAGQRVQLFSQAVLAGKEKRTAAAISFLEELIRQDPHPPAAIYNNLGNYYYMDDQIKIAISAYKKAIGVDPTSGIYHYNLSHAYIKESFSLTQSEASFIQAWKLAPEISNRQLAKGQNANAPVLIHEPLPWSYTYHYVTKHSLTSELKSDFFRQYFSPWGRTASYLTFIGIIVLIMSILWIKMDSSGRFCPLCGIRFHGIGRISDACPSCLHISRQTVNDSFAIRQGKKIRSFSWLMDGFFFLTGFVVPGTYQLALGQTVRGVFMLCGSFSIAGSIILLHEGMMNIALFPPGSAWGPLVFPLLLLIVFCLANYYSWRQRKQQRLILRITG
ncbi:MAG: tetratricopeptide repeat protein [Deltaproteobacteria bacterium]|nr:tetratricopeptide repeat protein [Deltaproteobacteria bacterium]